MPAPFRTLGKKLLHAGLAPRQVRRILTELREHLADLTERERAAGAPDAETRARAVLGDDDLLAAAILARQGAASRTQWLILAIFSPLLILAMFLQYEKSKASLTPDPALLDKYVGNYELLPDYILTVTRHGTHVLATADGKVTTELYPTSRTKFTVGKSPQQLRFVADTGGRISGLVLYNAGRDVPARRIDAAVARREMDALQQRIRENRPNPGTAASLRRYIESQERGQPNYDEMDPGMAAAVRQQFPGMQKKIKRWGALKSITFERVGPLGADNYDVRFEHGRVEWQMGRLTPDGKVFSRAYRERGNGSAP